MQKAGLSGPDWNDSHAEGKVNKVRSKAGFSLTELVVVVAIIMVVAGLSLPNLSRVLDNARLNAAAQQVASIYQQGRIWATRDNNYYLMPVTNGAQASQICLDLDGDGVCSANEPQAQISGAVELGNASVPSQLDATALGFTTALSSTENAVNYSQQGIVEPALAWNALGLPCLRASSTSPCSGPVAWVQYLNLRSGNDVLYAAVTVSPVGNVRIWHYEPGSGTGGWF